MHARMRMYVCVYVCVYVYVYVYVYVCMYVCMYDQVAISLSTSSTVLEVHRSPQL